MCRDYSSVSTCSNVWSIEFCDTECPEGETLDPTRYCKCMPDETYLTMFCEEQCECPSVYEPVDCYNWRTGTLTFNN